MIPSRRAFLAGGLSAAAWGLSARTEVPALTADGFLLLEAGPSQLRLGPPSADPAATLSYGGATPGPLLRLKKGEDLKLRLVNKLTEPTALSFSGLRTANVSAGYGGLTQPRLQPGASADIRFAPPDSGFNLYLPHAGSTDAGQQGRGLFGPIVIQEASKADVDQDVAIVLSDWNVDERGQIKDDFADPALARGPGRRGGLVFANGEAAPFKFAARPGARLRLRLGSAATARLTNVGIDGAKTFIVAVDGQPSEPFEPLRNQFPMGPGARFELMVDLPRAAGAKPAFVIPRGAPSVFAIANKTAVVQAMRLGGHVARLLHSMDDGWEPYWRDTILIQPGRTAHIAFVADNPGKWPIESAIPEHRAAGVGGWFQVG
jgi:FtsP/CotA-like multicopper oxidase with cupredoxin domain